MKKAKILEISPYPPPRAGWAVRVEFLKKALWALGHDCIPLNLGENRKIKSSEYEDVQNGLDYLRKVIKYSLKGYIVHMHANGDSPKGFILTLLSEGINFLLGKRPVLTFHAGPNQLYFPRKNSRLLFPLFYVIFTLPQMIICNNEAVKEKIMEYGINGRKIVPIPAFSVQYLSFDGACLPQELENFIEDHEPILCSYLALREEFYVESVLKSIKILVEKHSKLGLVIMGSLYDDSEKVPKLIKSLGIENNIYLAGDMPHDTFLLMLKRSKVYIRSHARDGVCSSVLEALSLKTPVVASEDDIRPASVITFQIGDENDLAQKTEYVLDNYQDIRANLISPEIKDTLKDEVELLISCYNSMHGASK